MAEMGDEGFSGWYAREQPRVFAATLVMCGDRDAARDVTAEAFARAFERWERVATMDRPGAWVHRVAVNIWKRQARRQGLERLLLRSSASRSDVVAAPDLDLELWAAVRDLPDRMRLAVGLRYIADLSEGEVAEAMGIASGTVAATLHAARRKLAGRLDDSRETANG